MARPPDNGSPTCRLLVAGTGQAVVAKATIARTCSVRLRGLLGRGTLPDDEALVFPSCRSIHTVGMQFPIDAIFVDGAWRVVALRADVRPGRILLPVWGAWGVIELARGTLARVGLKVGDRLCLTEA